MSQTEKEVVVIKTGYVVCEGKGMSHSLDRPPLSDPDLPFVFSGSEVRKLA